MTGLKVGWALHGDSDRCGIGVRCELAFRRLWYIFKYRIDPSLPGIAGLLTVILFDSVGTSFSRRLRTGQSAASMQCESG
jgi:hypothetical protein